MKRSWLTGMTPLIVLAALAFNLLSRLPAQTVEQWDEARHMASAVELLRSGDWLVTTYQGTADYWNLKPPLSVWTSALGLLMVSDPFVGARLFSLLAMVLTTLLVFREARRQGDDAAAFLTVIFLTASWPLFTSHAARTADPDMLFILGTTAAMCGFMAGSARGLWLAYAALGGAFLAKSFHVVPFGCAGFLYSLVLWRKGILPGRVIVLAPMAFWGPVLPWMLARYNRDGWHFLELMVTYDVLKRAGSGFVTGEQSSRWIYVDLLFQTYGFVFAAWGIVLAGHRGWRRILTGLPVLPILWITIPLLVFSASKTRLGWYIYPVFPAACVLLGLVFARSWPRARRLPRLLGFSVLCVGLIALEKETVGFIRMIVAGAHPVSEALVAVAHLPASAGPRRPVYLVTDPGLVYQQYYATALLTDRIDLQPGGRPAYAACAQRQQACWLIDGEGRIERSRP